MSNLHGLHDDTHVIMFGVQLSIAHNIASAHTFAASASVLEIAPDVFCSCSFRFNPHNGAIHTMNMALRNLDQ